METNDVYKNAYLNCHQVVVAAMLHREGIDIEPLFKQAGFFYREDVDYILVTPYHQNLADDLALYNDIHFYEKSYEKSETEQYVADVLHAVNELGVSVGVMCDSGELPYCIYYQNDHMWHMIEVLEIKDGMVEVLDHYYHHQGQISLEQLKKAIESVWQHTRRTTLKLTYFEREKTLHGTRKQLEVSTVMDLYCRSMEGKVANELYPFPDVLVGLEAIKVLSDKLVQIMDEAKPDAVKTLRYYFAGLKELANSRYHIYQLLKHFEWPEAELFLESYQCWTVIANLLARIFLKNNVEGMGGRLAGRFERAIQHESNLVKVLKEKVGD